MTTLDHSTGQPPHPAAHPAPASSAPSAPSAAWPFRRVGAVALAAAPLLFTAGLLTAPEQEVATRDGFVASLVENPTAAVTSASFLHYSWLAWVVGLIAVLGLVQGRGRGHAFTRITALLGILGAVQISGLLFGDLSIVAVGQAHSAVEAASVLEDQGTAGLVWLISAQVLALLPIPLVFAGLARAGYLRWYLAVPVFLATLVGGIPLPLHGGLVLSLLCQAAVFVVAVRLWRGPSRA